MCFSFTNVASCPYFASTCRRLCPDDDEHWLLYLQMMEIVDLLFSPKLTADHAAYLAALINDHHHDFCQLYPDCNIIPKMHFMIHIPRLIHQ